MKSGSFADESKSHKESEHYGWQLLVQSLVKTASRESIEEILTMFTTAYERKQIAKRVAASELLRVGKSYNEVSRALWLSPTIINALKKSLVSRTGYVSGYERCKKAGKKKIWSSFPATSKPARKSNVIMPHGKLAFPRRRRAR